MLRILSNRLIDYDEEEKTNFEEKLISEKTATLAEDDDKDNEKRKNNIKTHQHGRCCQVLRAKKKGTKKRRG